MYDSRLFPPPSPLSNPALSSWKPTSQSAVLRAHEGDLESACSSCPSSAPRLCPGTAVRRQAPQNGATGPRGEAACLETTDTLLRDRRSRGPSQEAEVRVLCRHVSSGIPGRRCGRRSETQQLHQAGRRIAHLGPPVCSRCRLHQEQVPGSTRHIQPGAAQENGWSDSECRCQLGMRQRCDGKGRPRGRRQDVPGD